MQRSDFTVGQTVFLKSADHVGDKSIIETTISKIGTKYVEVDYFGNRTQFKIIDGKEKDTGYGYGYNWIIYFSKQDILDEQECAILFRKISSAFKHRNEFSLDQLRRINVILEESEDETNII